MPASIPEPSSYAIVLVALGALGLCAGPATR